METRKQIDNYEQIQMPTGKNNLTHTNANRKKQIDK